MEYLHCMSLLQSIQAHISVFLLRRKQWNLENQLHIFSSPRGGSTWLMSMLAELPGVAPVWEPFHRSKGVVPTDWGDCPHPSTMDDQDQVYLQQVFSGHHLNAWTCSRTLLRNAIGAKQLLFKHVRANHLLPGLIEEYNLKHRPILLIRHPWDIVTSQYAAFGFWQENCTIEEVYPGHDELHQAWSNLNHLTDPFVRKLHLWCLINASLVQKYARCPDVILVHYHDLVLRPASEMTRIIQGLEWMSTEDSWSLTDFVSELDPRRTSDTDFYGDYMSDTTKQLWKNLSTLSESKKKQLQEVLDEYGFTMYSMNDIAPSKDY